MNNPSRRNFLTGAVGGTLASALRLSRKPHKDRTTQPLVIDLMGPMAYRWSGSDFEIWMPNLKGHSAGITTEVTSFELPRNDYHIKGTPGSPTSGNELTPWPTKKGQVYKANAVNRTAKNRLIYLTLPMPHSMAVLEPVFTKIYICGHTPPVTYTPYAVGLRLFYPQAGVPTLYDPSGVSTLILDGLIPFDPAPDEIESHMTIDYTPANHSDPTEPQTSFKTLSKLFGLNLCVDFEDLAAVKTSQATRKEVALMGPHHDCLAPTMQLP
jgi:hypothetical protein